MKITRNDGIMLELVCAGTYKPGNKCYWAVIDTVPEALQDEYCEGEYDTITVCLNGLKEDEFALNSDFVNCNENTTVIAVLEALAETTQPIRYIHSGFVDFPVFKFKEEIKNA